MPLTPDLRRGIDRIRDHLYGGGYPNPAQNAEQLSFLIFFYMFEAADAARVRAARRPKASPYASVFEGRWRLRNLRNGRGRNTKTVPCELLRWSSWANALNGERLVSWVREEVFPFYAGIAAGGVTDFMDGARLVIDEPTVLSQVVSQVNDLHLERVDADTKGDLFEHVLRQIRQAGELGQFRTPAPRHPRHGAARGPPPRGDRLRPGRRDSGGSWSAPTTTSGSRTRRRTGSRRVEAEGKTVRRGLGDTLSRDAVRRLHEATFFGNDVDPQMVRLATMNLTLRGLDRVRILRPRCPDPRPRPGGEGGTGPAAGGLRRHSRQPAPSPAGSTGDRIVEEVKVGRTAQTELLFLQYMLNHLKEGGRCGVVVPEGVLFGSTGAHRELRRKLVENKHRRGGDVAAGRGVQPLFRGSRPPYWCSARAAPPSA